MHTNSYTAPKEINNELQKHYNEFISIRLQRNIGYCTLGYGSNNLVFS
jgi:hypothetical protein